MRDIILNVMIVGTAEGRQCSCGSDSSDARTRETVVMNVEVTLSVDVAAAAATVATAVTDLVIRAVGRAVVETIGYDVVGWCGWGAYL